MSQLIKATLIPFESIKFKQNASMVSAQMLDTARRQAIARQRAFAAQNSVHSASANSDYMTQVQRAFSSHSAAPAVPQVTQSSAAAQVQVQTQTAAQTQATVQDYAQSVYLQEKGSFEMRVAKGEVSYVPALAMTVVTQYPDVQYEYLGGFQYVPPSAAPIGEKVNLSL